MLQINVLARRTLRLVAHTNKWPLRAVMWQAGPESLAGTCDGPTSGGLGCHAVGGDQLHVWSSGAGGSGDTG